VTDARFAAALVIVVCIAAVAAPAAAQPPPRTAAGLPSVIPIFPLPELVLFPQAVRPLYIFEPRYRAMVADALKGNRLIGMVLLRPGFEQDYDGRPPIYGVGTAGQIVDYEELPDGQYLILLRAVAKFRVLGEDQSRAYRLARVETVPEPLADADLAPLSALRQKIEPLYLQRIPANANGPDPALSDEAYVNVVAQNLDMPEPQRQELLEQSNALVRARSLIELLGGR
jgi:Lon protease-like protein